MNKGIIITTIAIFASLGVFGVLSKRPVGAEIAPVVLGNAQVIEWTKPSTDEGWAEDVKVESLEIRSNKVLEEMRDVHTEKLHRMEADDEILVCPECIKYDMKKAHPEFSQAEIDSMYAEQLLQKQQDIASMQRSIERMNKELELREKGFVKVVSPTKNDKRFDPRTDEFKESNKSGSKIRTPLE